MRGDTYQILLIIIGIIVAALFGAFLMREIFPEYKIYQKDYVALEEFRSTYTNQAVPPFQYGVKQIVLEREDNGPPVVDRCISCHVALQIPYFSPTKISHDEKGNTILVPNDDYIWNKLDKKISDLRDKKVLEHLETQGEKREIKQRLELADRYEALKTAHIGEYTYDVTKVLAMHPLIGDETYPFETHPMEEYGCTSCHSGNGRGLTTDKAHGPVFDNQYEIEDLGPLPHIIDKDPKNDPRFSRIFNHKPGENLIFQTEPILAGSLIQAKCIQCHQTSGIHPIENHSMVEETTKSSKIDRLTLNYQQGMDLYISQACYACHRIAGFARGGVGPELTFAGNSYPWYLKRKLVWPQGDLATSTMPNMHFDHVELEDMMTFLLAQKGGNNAMGKTAYQSALHAWEAGKKMAWEAPVAPSEIYNLQSSMTIFATEGCAACHRLQGFESNVGFAAEKENLYEEQIWFKKLFPEVVHISQYDEELPGSELTARIEKHAEEIDKRIVSDVRVNGLLEEIDQSHSGVIESYYSPFRYASRAKDHEYQSLIENENDPEKKKILKQQLSSWKERVHRVLMMYIQTYGLGRLIGPHLNWSGIYRSDEWLMEHFRNPTSHIPRSLMPVFPFDDTKFYALTYMLDRLAIHNRDTLRKMWTERGFDPAESFNMLCAQCHGIDRVGNGAIAEWIYPIPKNLHNADFLRNLTKEKAFYSLVHGVKGTPMPPWGEVADPKPEERSHQIPVMTESEIQYLVNWLYSTLPGGEVIRQTEDVPKWQYAPQEVLEELKSEGGKLSSLNDQIFNKIDQKTDTGNESYYIKKEIYTPENIEAGKTFFLANCAVCHGNEADGNSLRAGVMQEAKPRILTNLDWIQSRDDLRLLRSIKYGVPGTAMTPWGDLTSSLQRIQLVMFIRSLSFLQERREKLSSALYLAYDDAQFIVETVRIKNSKEMEKWIKEKELEEKKRQEFEVRGDAKKAVDAYQNIFKNDQLLKELKIEDQKYLDLEALIKNEKNIYFNLGVALINKDAGEALFQNYLDLIKLNDHRYSEEGGSLTFSQGTEIVDKIHTHLQSIAKNLDDQILKLENDKDLLKGKISSAKREDEMQALQLQIDSYKKLKEKFKTDVEDAIKSANKQKLIVQELKN